MKGCIGARGLLRILHKLDVESGVQTMHQINIFIHIFAGVLALLVGIVSFASQKGGARHAVAGRIFLGLMGAVLVTAGIGVIFFRDRPFLALLTIQTFYLS